MTNALAIASAIAALVAYVAVLRRLTRLSLAASTLVAAAMFLTAMLVVIQRERTHQWDSLGLWYSLLTATSLFVVEAVVVAGIAAAVARRRRRHVGRN